MSTLGAVGAALAGPPGAALTVALIALLVAREALPVAGGRAARRWRVALSVVATALLVAFAAVVAARFLFVAAPTTAAGFPTPAAVGRTLTGEPPTTAAAATATPVAAAPAPSATPGATPSAAAPSTPAIPTVATPATAATGRVAAAVAQIQTGQFEVSIRYANAAESATLLQFDFGGGGQPPRLASQTTYRGTTGARTVERVVIGERTWTRQPGASWAIANAAQDVPEEVWPLLPLPGAALAGARPAGPNALRWYDPARDADLRLEYDPSSGQPLRLEQTARGTGTVLTVVYRGWNVPVAITPPTER